MLADYAGIAGAYPDPAGRNTGVDTATGPNNAAVREFAHGIMSRAGLLVNNEWKGIHNCQDGTSNTFIVGETSDYLRVISATDAAIVLRLIRTGSNYGGAWLGSGCDSALVATPDSTIMTLAAKTNFYGCGIVTVRYPINYDKRTKLTEGTVPGISTAVPLNALFTSSHPGGAQFALADASVRFVSDTISLETLQILCVADSDKVAPSF